MKCHQVSELIELHALGELEPRRRQAVDDHLADCRQCASLAEATGQVIEELRASRPARPANALFMHRLHSLAEQSAARPRPVLARLAGISAVAAALLLAAAGWWIAASRHVPGPAVTASTPASPAPVVQVWHRAGAMPTPAAGDDTVIVRDDTVYLLVESDGTARAAALAADSGGQPRWLSRVESVGHLAIDKERLYCLAPGQAAGQLDLAALSLADGRLLWRVPQDHASRIRQPIRPVPLEGGRVCWTTNSGVLMIDAATGQTIWSIEIADHGELSAARLLGNRLYVATSKGLLALSPQTGEQVATIALAGQAGGFFRPVLESAGDRLIAAMPARGGGSRVVCIRPGHDQPDWIVATPFAFHLHCEADRIYVRSQDVLALDLRDGAVLWRQPARGCSPITSHGGLIYYVNAGDGGGLVAVDAATGELAWHLPGMRSCDAFVTAAGIGYLKTQDGVLRAMMLGKL